MHISAMSNEYRGRKVYYFKTFTAGVGFPSIRGIEAIVLDMSSITSIFVAQTHSIQYQGNDFMVASVTHVRDTTVTTWSMSKIRSEVSCRKLGKVFSQSFLSAHSGIYGDQGVRRPRLFRTLSQCRPRVFRSIRAFA